MAMFTSACSDNYPAGVNDFDIIDAFGHGDWHLDYKCKECAYCVPLEEIKNVYVCIFQAMEERQHEVTMVETDWQACENLELKEWSGDE